MATTPTHVTISLAVQLAEAMLAYRQATSEADNERTWNAYIGLCGKYKRTRQEYPMVDLSPYGVTSSPAPQQALQKQPLVVEPVATENTTRENLFIEQCSLQEQERSEGGCSPIPEKSSTSAPPGVNPLFTDGFAHASHDITRREALNTLSLYTND